jgi:Ras-related protein Rab-18
MKNPATNQSFTSTTDEIRYKIILVGDSSVGKSSLLMKFTTGKVPDKNTITMIDFKTKEFFLPESRDTVKLHIWDTAGQ